MLSAACLASVSHSTSKSGDALSLAVLIALSNDNLEGCLSPEGI